MLYKVLKAIARFLFFIGRVRVEGKDLFPEEGRVIVAANHRSFWDPVLVAVYIKRDIHYMAKEELFEHELMAKFLEKLHAFPVKRGAPDRKALRTALEILEKEMVLGIFPEGTRSKTGEMLKPQTGIALLALKSRAKVVPVACIGTDKIFPLAWFSPVVVRFGTPVEYSQYYDARLNTAVLEEVSKDIMAKIEQLLTK